MLMTEINIVKKIRRHDVSLKGPFKNDVIAKLTIFAPPPPLSPFVAHQVEPPPPYVTGPNGDKLFS